MTFLHWAYDADDLQGFLPRGLEIDTHEGKAWVGLTPFVMVDFALACLRPVPVLSRFPETNVRTYVRGPDGKDGLWFLSLEADSLLTVVGASCGYGVPYRWARMSVDEGPTVRYRSERRVGRPAGHRIAVRPQRPFPPEGLSDFDHWLTGRWRAYTTIAGRLATAPVQHEPWPLWEADLEVLDENLMVGVGLAKPDGEPVVHYSPGVAVRLGRPHFV